MNSEQQTIESLIRQLTEKKQALLRGIEQIDGALEGIRTAARLLEGGALGKLDLIAASQSLPALPALTTTNMPNNEALRRELKGKTQLAALMHLAKKNGGLLKIVDGKEALIAAGLMKRTKNSYNITFNTATRSGRFTKESPGVVRLIEENQQMSMAS